uniref:Uncharacterized protein n=1 Tax=Lepeophtheirus salmonis TaxID=72036 RepID=A0A0K2U4W3_LEPSM
MACRRCHNITRPLNTFVDKGLAFMNAKYIQRVCGSLHHRLELTINSEGGYID